MRSWLKLSTASAVGLGLLADPEVAEAGFKPFDIARTLQHLLKYQGQTPRGVQRATETFKVMTQIPEREYKRYASLEFEPGLSYGGSPVRGLHIPKTPRLEPADYLKNTIKINPQLMDVSTFPHEQAHAWQASHPAVLDYLHRIRRALELWFGPEDAYHMLPAEKHANLFAGHLRSSGWTEIAPGAVERLQRKLLKEAVESSAAEVKRYPQVWESVKKAYRYPHELRYKDVDMLDIFEQQQDQARRHFAIFGPKLSPERTEYLAKRIAAGGAVLLALHLEPMLNESSEAHAMPRGVYEPIVKALRGKPSSTAKELIGKTLEEGKVIKNVLKGEGEERIIEFTDNTMSRVTNRDLHTLMRHFGTQKYIQRFSEVDEPSKLTQALKSMVYHEARAVKHPMVTKDPKGTILKEYIRQYRQDLSEMGKTLQPDVVFVTREDMIYTMPRQYAELLEEQGILKIIKDKEFRSVLND